MSEVTIKNEEKRLRSRRVREEDTSERAEEKNIVLADIGTVHRGEENREPVVVRYPDGVVSTTY